MTWWIVAYVIVGALYGLAVRANQSEAEGLPWLGAMIVGAILGVPLCIFYLFVTAARVTAGHTR